MRRPIPTTLATILLAVTLVSSCLIAGCAGPRESQDEGTQLSVNGVALALPEGFEKIEPPSFIEIPYADGTVTARMVRAKNADLRASVTLARVEGRDFDAIKSWANGLPESAGEAATASSFGMFDDFHGSMPDFPGALATPEELEQAAWDKPSFYSTDLGYGAKVSYVAGGTRTTALYVDMGAGIYVEVRGSIPEAAYAEDPEYFDGIFSSVREYRESSAVSSASNIWILVGLLFFPICLVATLVLVLLRKPIRGFIESKPALESRYQKIKAAGPKEGWSGYVLGAVILLFLFGGAVLIFLGTS